MRRLLAFVLVLCIGLSATACQENVPPAQTAETTVATTATTEPTETVAEETFVSVPEPLTWDRINALPIASSDMSSDELRQLCVDYMRLQLSFQWTPNDEFSYIIATYNKPIGFHVGKVYAGLPYNGPNGGPSGNIYTLMEYYDSESGVLDVKTLGTQRLSQIISNHCSTSTFWAWARVVNTMRHYNNASAKTGFENSKMNKYYGFLPVGPYDYEIQQNWRSGGGTLEVCLSNGKQVMYESYANVLPGDGCITLFKRENARESNHVAMFSSKPVIVYNEDGTINGDKSYVLVYEQTSTPESYFTEAGDYITLVGNLDNKYTFYSMFQAGYVPFTFAEFQGTDPVEDGQVTLKYSNHNAFSFEKIASSTLSANYPISNIYITVTDKDGNSVYRGAETPYAVNTSTLPMNMIFDSSKEFEPYFISGNRITIDVRLSTGEVLNALDVRF